MNALKGKIKEAFKKWFDEIYIPFTKKRTERKEKFQTVSFEEVSPLYSLDEKQNEKYLEDISFPGVYPYTRGVQPTMYRGKLWTMRQYAGFGTAKQSNERYRYLLTQGTTGLSVAFDLPTQIGYDSDSELALGEVGKVGVAIDTLADMEILFDKIPLDKISTSMTINSTAAVLLAMYIVVAEKNKVSLNEIKGTIQNDILKEYIARGTYIFPPKPSMRIITDIFEYCAKEIPKWNTISISGYHIREAGSTAAQEVGFTLANGITYVDAATKAGLNVDDFAGQLSFFFNSHNDLLEEVAKFRAARRLWAKIMKERFDAKNERSMKLRFHTQTAGSTLTAQQIDNNIARVTIQTLAAVLGGTQSLHTNSKDEALALPTEDSVRTALRTQQIVAHESGIANTIDPLAGSYFIEEMTDQIEAKAKDYIDKIDSLGGVISAIESGYVQGEIQNAAYEYEKEIENGSRIIVGMNKFKVEEETTPSLLKINEKAQEEQIKFLNSVKVKRNNGSVAEKLTSLKNAAKGNDNLMPFIMGAVREYATIGEICDSLRDIFGEYKENVII